MTFRNRINGLVLVTSAALLMVAPTAPASATTDIVPVTSVVSVDVPVLAVPAVPTASVVQPAAAAAQVNNWEAKVVKVINNKRAARGLVSLRHESGGCIDGHAERWSRHLASTSGFYHQNMHKVVKACRTPWVGENLVRGSSLSPKAAVNAWMASPSHREILLKRRARVGSIGARVSSDGMIYASAILKS